MADRGPIKPSSGTLVPVRPSEIAADEREKGLRRRIDMIASNDEKIVADVSRFSDLPHPTLEPAAWGIVTSVLANGTDDDAMALGFKSKKALRRAIYGRLSKRDVPFAIQAAHERVMARVRKEGKKGDGQAVSLTMINIPAPKPVGPDERVIIIHPEEK